MWRYSTFDLDPDSDVDEALRKYAEAGWHTWAAGTGAVIELNGRRVRRVWLRREGKSTGPRSQPT